MVFKSPSGGNLLCYFYQNLPNVQAVGRLRYRAQEANRVMLRSTMSKTPEEISRYSREFDESLVRYEELTKKYLETPFLPGEEALFKKIESHWAQFTTVAKDVIKLAGIPDQQAKLDKLLDEEIPKVRRPHDEALSELLAFHDTRVGESKLEAANASSRAESLIGIVIGMGFIVATAIGYMFASSLAKSLGRISGDISSAADQTSASGNELSAASQQLSAGSSEAAASLEETVASLEELSSMVKLNADHAKEANALS